MPFVASTQIQAKTVQTGAFFADIDSKDFAETTRLDGSVSTPRLVASLELAIINVERELKDWLAAHSSDYADLAAYDNQHQTRKCTLYKLAVYNTARAELTQHHKDFDSTPNQKIDDDDIQSAVDEYRRTVRDCITLFFDGWRCNDGYNSNGTMTVDLI